MSGFGLALDSAGDIYFSTGNTAPGSYDSAFNIAESAVRMSGDLNHVVDFFTPSDHNTLDSTDQDFGAGGLMVLPDQPGLFPHLAAGAGKDGRMFLLNRDAMGGLHTPDIPQHVDLGRCWCGPSYFNSTAGPRVVSSGGTTSGGSQVKTWALTSSLGQPGLNLVASSAPLAAYNSQDPSFFTSVSSNGITPNTTIIWAAGRASGSGFDIRLYAFDATPSGVNLPLIWSGVAGNWPNIRANANIVPTIANGRVYVASNKELQIFGLRP